MSRRLWRSLAITGWAAALGASCAAAACPDHLKFLGAKCAQWQATVLPGAPPAARGNAQADSQAAAAFGMKIFYDNRFSQSGSGIACASCHDPEHAFAERKPTSDTLRPLARNAPALIDAAWYSGSHFWDGKVDNLWSAPLFTFEQADEMNSSRLEVAHAVWNIYRARYEKLFGAMPDLSDDARFPPAGRPGAPAFDTMTATDQRQIDQIYANVGKALEAYIRKLAAGRAPLDDFILGAGTAINEDAKRGMLVFTRQGCDSCHSGPTFSDEKFHDLRGPARRGRPADAARAGGVAFSRSWEFNATSLFADADNGTPQTLPRGLDGDANGFRTPTLRNVELTSPYGHDGSFPTLESAMAAHSQVLAARSTPQDMHDLLAFLRALDGRPPSPPWNYWPGG